METTTLPTLNVLTHVLEDDETIVELLQGLFKLNGFDEDNVKYFHESDEFLQKFSNKVHICVIDYYLNGPLNGIDVTQIVLNQNPMCKVIMITGAEDRKIYQRFHNIGGFKSVCKHDKTASEEIVTYMQQAITAIRAQIDLWLDLLKDYKPAKPLSIEAGTLRQNN